MKGDSIVQFNKGFALIINLKKYEKAIECFDESIRINPNHSTAWIFKGLALNDLEKYEEAIKCYSEAIRLEPESLCVWRKKGDALIKLGKYNEARECFSISQKRKS